MRTSTAAAISILLALSGCPTPRRTTDAAVPGVDAPAPPLDAPFFTPDAFAATPDAFLARVDARTELDAAMTAADDAFVVSDAFVGADAPVVSDARAPSDAPRSDAGPVACTPLPASGSATSSGDTSATGLRWRRPLAGTCPATSFSSVATDVPQQTFVFCNEGAAGTFDLEVTALFDSYLVVYDGPAIPSDPLMCLDGDDDSGLDGALVSGLAVAAGGTITVVVSGFDNSDSGAFTLAVTRL